MTQRILRLGVVAILAVVGTLTNGCTWWDPLNPGVNTSRSPAVSTHGMVSSAHPIATKAGLRALRAGGNAFDAAIAVAATLNVVEPMNSGIGGYGLILIHHAESGRTRALNSSGRFPRGVDSDVFRAPTPDYEENRRGAKAISTPTNVNAWAALWKEYGSVRWPALFMSAIEAAEEGHRLNASVARSIAGSFDRFSDYTKSFYGKNGKPLGKGARLVQSDLAKSLRLIAENGAAVVYEGEIGQAIDAEMRESGGFLRMEDLEANQAEWGEPIRIEYRGFEVVAPPPPANSWTSLQRLGMMERFNSRGMRHNSAAYLHRFAEVTKHAYWNRLKYAGDPEVSPPPLERLLSDEYFESEARALDLARSRPFESPGLTSKSGAETTHFVVADGWGNVVCATQTLGGGFGSKVMIPGYGIWMNNSMYFCTFEPKGNPMDAHAGRRKLISNHPTIIFKYGRPVIAVGTPGGHTIGQSVAQMVINMIDFGMDIQDAIRAPRVAFVEPDRLSVEESIDEDVRAELEAMGHNVRTSRRIGNAHGLTIEYGRSGRPEIFMGGADPRGRGEARGF